MHAERGTFNQVNDHAEKESGADTDPVRQRHHPVDKKQHRPRRTVKLNLLRPGHDLQYQCYQKGEPDNNPVLSPVGIHCCGLILSGRAGAESAAGS